MDYSSIYHNMTYFLKCLFFFFWQNVCYESISVFFVCVYMYTLFYIGTYTYIDYIYADIIKVGPFWNI